MWEYRLIWPGAPPPWWDTAWRLGLNALTDQGRKVEKRPDTYLVLLDRADAGLKLRGGQEEDFDLKVLHRRTGGWELWEKCAFFKWDSLEVLRLAAMLQVPPPAPRGRGDLTPGRGVAAFLAAAELQARQLVVDKKRLQTAVGDLLAAWPGSLAAPGWIAELVEITLPDRKKPLFSLCLEAMAAVAGDPVPTSAALVCGYPELLRKHLKNSL